MILLACLAFLSANDAARATSDAPAPIYKWRDAKGNLFITDRLDDVPKELRAKLQKRDEEAKAKKPKAAAPKATAPPPAEESAYARLQKREKQEREIKERSHELRTHLAQAQAKQRALNEERGYLASNPVLNAAQPARVQRMQDIDEEKQALEKDRLVTLTDLKELVTQTQAAGLPEEWATGEE